MSITEPTTTDTMYLRFRVPEGHWSCTSKGDEPYDSCFGTVLQVLNVEPGGTGWYDHGRGVCQKRRHRENVHAEMRRRYGMSESQVDLTDPVTGQVLDDHPAFTDASSLPDTPTTIDLPGHTELQRRVLTYLLGNDGSRSTRHEAFQWLAEQGVFEPGIADDYLESKLQELVEENPMSACLVGVAKFRDAFDLGSGIHRWKARIVQAGTDVSVGEVTWECEADEPGDAEDKFTSMVPLGDIDRHLSCSLDELDQEGVVFESGFDVVLADIEDLGSIN